MNIVVISYNKFPEGNAGAIREYMFGKIFVQLNHKVLFVGMGENNNFKKTKYKEVEYISLRNKQKGKLNQYNNYIGYKYRLQKTIDKLYREGERIDAFLVIDIPPHALKWVEKYAIKNNIQLIHDSVEWYSPEQFKLKKIAIPYILKNRLNTKVINSRYKVIAISRYLQTHFENKKITTIRVPVLIDLEEVEFNKKEINDKITLIYAGTPGTKDHLKEILDGYSMLTDDKKERIEIKIIGITKKQLIDITKVSEQLLSKYAHNIKVMGRITREQVLKELNNADFTVLLRDEKSRYAKAGFPTKVVESLGSGTPILLNYSSDLREYLNDKENCIVIPECSAESFSNGLIKVLELSKEERKNMFYNCRQTAEKYFDYKNYKTIIHKFLIK